MQIGKNYKPYIVAELSGNHNGNFLAALKSVRLAAECGVSAIKLQTYTADTMTINVKKKDFKIKNKSSLWNGYYLYDLYKKSYTPWSWHKRLFNEAKKNKIDFFSTPFDLKSLDFLKRFNLPFYKISSFENTDLRLIKNVAKTKKPLIISLGTANLKEIVEAYQTAKKNGCKEIILMKCTSDYPADEKDANLETIEFLKKKFKCEVGLSDHTKGIGTSVAAIAKGATLIEKHFIINKKINSLDNEFSLDPNEMKLLVEECNRAWKSIGKIQIQVTKREAKNLKFRRSIYVVKEVKKGEFFNNSNIACIRPGYGLATINFEKILGKKAKRTIVRGEPLSWNVIEK